MKVIYKPSTTDNSLAVRRTSLSQQCVMFAIPPSDLQEREQVDCFSLWCALDPVPPYWPLPTDSAARGRRWQSVLSALHNPACVTHKVLVASSSSWNFKFSTEGESVVATVFLTQFLVSLRIGEDCVRRQRSAQRWDWRVFLFYDWAKRGPVLTWYSAFLQPVYLFVFNVVTIKHVGQPLWNSVWYPVQWHKYVFMKIYFMIYFHINLPEIVPSL